MSSLKFIGEAVPYEKIAQEISAVKGVVAHGLMLDVASAAVIASGLEPKIIEKVGCHCISIPPIPGFAPFLA